MQHQQVMPPLNLYYSYADADERFLKRLETQLDPLFREGLISGWHHGKSGNDIYLRDMLFMDMNSAQNPIVQQLWEKFARAVDRNQSPAAKQALPTSQLVRLHTTSGIFRGWAYELTLPRKQVTEVLSMMTRGLYQYYVGRVLPRDSQFEVMRVQGDLRPFENTVQLLLQQGAPFIRVGDGEVFKCIYACWAARPELSLWFLCFYKSVVFSVVTNRQVSEQARFG